MEDIIANTNNDPERTEVENCSPSGHLCIDLSAVAAVLSLIVHYFRG